MKEKCVTVKEFQEYFNFETPEAARATMKKSAYLHAFLQGGRYQCFRSDFEIYCKVLRKTGDSRFA